MKIHKTISISCSHFNVEITSVHNMGVSTLKCSKVDKTRPKSRKSA